MAVKVSIPVVLRNLTSGKSDVDIEGKSVIDMVNQLDKKFPGIKERICEGDKLRRFVNVFVNEEDIRFLKGAETELKEGDQVSIIPAIAGGGSTSSPLATRQIHLTFPPRRIKEPVIYKLGREFKVVTNIRRANVTQDAGWVDLEIEGDEKEIERGVAWLKKMGVRVDPVTGDIVEG